MYDTSRVFSGVLFLLFTLVCQVREGGDRREKVHVHSSNQFLNEKNDLTGAREILFFYLRYVPIIGRW